MAWLVRNSYGGVLNPSWPGLTGKALAPEWTATLRYRIYVHLWDAEAGMVREAYEAYAAGRAP